VAGDNFTEQQILDGLADDLADPEGDGLCNLAEFALGTDPWEFTPLPAATLDENGLTLTFTRPAGLVGVAYAAESSDAWMRGRRCRLKSSIPTTAWKPCAHATRLPRGIRAGVSSACASPASDRLRICKTHAKPLNPPCNDPPMLHSI
jgi:hypothetical protein